MLRRLGRLRGSQGGFTLIEMLVSIAISGFISVGIAMAAVQVMNVNDLSTNRVVAVKQVENAAYWINRDVRMAQTIQPGVGSGFPLNLSWVEWDNTTRQVSYAINNGELRRSSSTNGTQTEMLVGQYIESNDADTNCQYANGVFTFKLTASLGGFRPARETRIAQVIPRSAQ